MGPNKNINLHPYDEIKQEHSTYTLMTKSNKNIQLIENYHEHSTYRKLSRTFNLQKTIKNIQLTENYQEHSTYRKQTRTFRLHPYDEIKHENSTKTRVTKSNKNIQLTPL